MRERTLAAGGSEQQAWRSAVGAYLEVHPGADLFTAERIVTCLLRPPPPTGPSSALG
ncbi:hypothetical protein [Roseospira navarrensis]|uniref:Uncharacterized protein n=1 Tax=Roseospira navarrensis TaxID=140058 RepID=A0A7X1ZBS7_9PROT|nr:hypothetical protein [Roseospira navarrensis]MQX35666.1 hypothetical protein [Roseospira navarrensis]